MVVKHFEAAGIRPDRQSILTCNFIEMTYIYFSTYCGFPGEDEEKCPFMNFSVTNAEKPLSTSFFLPVKRIGAPAPPVAKRISAG